MTVSFRHPPQKPSSAIPAEANKSRDLQTEALLARAFYEYRREDFKKAASISRYLVTTQGHPEAFRIFASASHRAGDDQAALDTYPRALKAFPEDLGLLVGYAELLLDRHEFERAAEYLRRALELDPDAADPAGARARVLIVKASDAGG